MPNGQNGVEMMKCPFMLELEKIPEDRRDSKVCKLSTNILKTKEEVMGVRKDIAFLIHGDIHPGKLKSYRSKDNPSTLTRCFKPHLILKLGFLQNYQ